MHQHKGREEQKSIGLVFFLNFTFTIIEFIGGLLTNSTAIMADAIHDLGDSLSIGLSWFLAKQSNKNPTEEFSYGYRRFSLLAAFINAIVLILGSIYVLLEAIPRLSNPQMPMVKGMFFLAIFGVLVNGFAAFKLSKGNTLNERILNWHLLEDVLGWIAVLIISIILYFFNWPILDPVLSIIFTLFILVNVLRNLYQTMRLFLQAAPDANTIDAVKQSLMKLECVTELHKIHIWSLDGEHHVFTAHLVLDKYIDHKTHQALKNNISEILSEYKFVFTTIELEFSTEKCRDGSNKEVIYG